MELFFSAAVYEGQKQELTVYYLRIDEVAGVRKFKLYRKNFANRTFADMGDQQDATPAVGVTDVKRVARICFFSNRDSRKPVLAIDAIDQEIGAHGSVSQFSVGADGKSTNVQVSIPPLLWGWKDNNGVAQQLWRLGFGFDSSECWDNNGTPKFKSLEATVLRSGATFSGPNPFGRSASFSEVKPSSEKPDCWAALPYFRANVDSTSKPYFGNPIASALFSLDLGVNAQKGEFGGPNHWAHGRAWKADIAFEFASIPHNENDDIPRFALQFSRLLGRDGDQDGQFNLNKLDIALRNSYFVDLDDAPPKGTGKAWNVAIMTVRQADEMLIEGARMPLDRKQNRTPWIAGLEFRNANAIKDVWAVVGSRAVDAAGGIDGHDDPSFVPVLRTDTNWPETRVCVIAGFELNRPHDLPDNDERLANRIEGASLRAVRFGSFRSVTETTLLYATEGVTPNVDLAKVGLPLLESLSLATPPKELHFSATLSQFKRRQELGRSLASRRASVPGKVEFALSSVSFENQNDQKFRFGELDLVFAGGAVKDVAAIISFTGSRDAPVAFEIFGAQKLGAPLPLEPSNESPWTLPLKGGSPNGSVRDFDLEREVFPAPVRGDVRVPSGSGLIWISDQAGTLIPNGKLRVLERATPDRGRVLSARIYADSTKASASKIGIVRLDPFFVGSVEIPALAGRDTSIEIATWQNLSGAPSGWSFRVPDGDVTVVFPPQGLGEATLKHQKPAEKPAPEIEDGKLAQARLTPVATLKARPSYFESNFVQSPWDPAMLFGYAGQRAPGALVRSLDAEFTYGLNVKIEPQNVRAAELAALKGAAPVALTADMPQWAPISKLSEAQRTDITQGFRGFVVGWNKRLSEHRSRVAAIELWRDGAGSTLHLKEDVEYALRREADVRRPVPLPPSTVARSEFSLQSRNDKPDCPEGLAKLPGGAEWGFESPLIYEKILHAPKSFAGEIAGVRLGARGGTAWQKAVFDNGLTTIYATVDQGRTHVYTVERIGRIAGLWHRAKHVLQYERSAGTSDQMVSNGCDKDLLKGRAALRKVAEYVELIEPERRYPDIGGSEAGLGPLRGVRFRSRIIPVNGDWGGDFGVEGWRVPLWKRGATGVYEIMPQIEADFACDPARGDAVAGQIENPDRLYFFTSVKENSANTDAWKAVMGVDTPATAPPEAPPWGLGGLLPTELDAVPPGFEDLTLAIGMPEGVQADLNAGRAGKAMGARLRSVSIARGRPRSRDEIRRRLAEIANENEKTANAAVVGPGFFLDGIVAAIRNGAKIEDIQAKIKEAQDTVDKFVGQCKSLNPGGQKSFCELVQGEALDAIKALDGTFDGWRTKFIQDLRTLERNDVAQFIVAANERLGIFQAQVVSRIRGLDLGRSKLQQETNRAIDGLTGVASSATNQLRKSAGALKGCVTAFSGTVDVVWNERDKRCVASRNAVNTSVDEVALCLERLKKQASDVATAFPGMAAIIDAFSTAITTAESGLGDFKNQIVVRIDSVQDSIDRDAMKASLTNLNKLADDYVAKLTAEIGKVEAIANGPLTDIENLLGKSDGPLADARKSVDDKFAAAEKKLVQLNNATGIEAILVAVDQDLKSLGQDIADKIGNKIQQPIKAICAYASGPNWNDLDNYSKKLAKELEELAKVGDLKQIGARALALISTANWETANLTRKASAFCEDWLAKNKLPDLRHAADGWLRTLRVLGDPPDVPNLDFKLPGLDWRAPLEAYSDRLAYYFDEARSFVATTPCFGIVRDAGNALENFGLHLPSIGLGERLLPPVELGDFKVPDLFKNMGGLNIGDGLFPGISLPAGIGDNVKITHGFDKETKTGWLEANIDVAFGEPVDVFNVQPVRIYISNATFVAKARAEAKLAGAAGVKERWGRIGGNWVVDVGGQPALTFRNSFLKCDEGGHLDFDTGTDRIETAPALLFLQKMTEQFSKKAEEAGFGLIEVDGKPVGIRKGIDLPLPPMIQGAWGVTGLHFAASMALYWANPLDQGGDEFSLAAALHIGSPTSPFTITVFVLGGCGWVKVETRYVPKTGKISTDIDIAIGASAMIGFNAGVFVGTIQIYIAVKVRYTTELGGGVNISFLLGLVGSVTVIGIIDVEMAILLEARLTPDNRVEGEGSYSAEVRISRFFKKRVERRIHQRL